MGWMIPAAIAGTAVYGAVASDKNSKRGLKAQKDANARTQAFIESQAKLGRGDVNALYAYGDDARNASYNEAMDVLGEGMPYQMSAFQEGNIAAQKMHLAGMPQYQNAILGLPVDNNALQPYRGELPDSSLYSQTLPDFGRITAPEEGPLQYEPAGSWEGLGASIGPQEQQSQQQQQDQINSHIMAMIMGSR